MHLVYLAGPYSSTTIFGIKKNIDKAEEIAIWLWKLGYSVICPHKNTAFLDGEVSFQQFIDGDLEQLKRCDLIVIMPNWQNSKGTKIERKFAYTFGIPVFYYDNVIDRMQLKQINSKEYSLINHMLKQEETYELLKEQKEWQELKL